MSESGAWSEGNQRALGAALQELRLFLEEHAAAAKETPGPGEADFRQAHEQVLAAEQALSAPSALARLTSVFGLSPFESRLLLLCAAVELDGRFSSLCEAAGGEGHSGVTYGLALAALPGAHWEALAPGSPLRYWRLIEVGPGPTLTASPLRIDERILHFLTGTQATDERLPLSTLLLPEDAPLSEPDRAAAASIAESWASQFRPVVQVSGKDRELQLALVRAAAELLNMDFEILPAAAVPTAAREAQNLARLWNREIALDDRVLVIECDELGEGDRALERSMAIVLGEVQGPVAVCTRGRLTFGSVATVLVEVEPSTDASQKEAWRRALGDRFAPLEPEVERLATQFRLSTPLIDAAAGIAAGDENASPQDTGKALWDYCRRQARPRLDALAERIDTTAAWDDLVLPDAQTAMLREIVAQVRYRSRVYGQWGFGLHGGRSQGVTSLFAGPSGTGKTFAAEILSSDLHLDLYRIDLSAVVSKYIGETEKNLRRVFDAAEDGGAILLFDEADALFGKRSDVKDSHDRYANIEVSYLLQRMEAYRGLAILTTNMRQALDPAFLRRLRFVVEFPFPGPEERAAIWQRSIPAAAPTQEVDVSKLARLAMTGGNIRNICLSAAFAAAADGSVIRMKHLLHGARAESLKLERTLSESETRDWC